MKKLVIFFVVLGFSVSLVVVAGAHLGEPKYVFQFPDHLIPVMDGDLSDWDIVPEAYWVTADKMHNQFSAAMDLSDLNARYAWAWNDTKNRLYFGCWRYDDMLHSTEHLSIQVDPSHCGLQYDKDWEGYTEEETKRWRNARGQKYDFAGNIEGRELPIRTKNAATWMFDLPWTEWGWRQIEGIPNDFETSDAAEYELMITPWEDLHWMGPEQGKIVDLEEGMIIGAEVCIHDKDLDPGAYDEAYWSTFGGVNAWKFADQMGDWELAPVEAGLIAVESVTWGRIKSTFVK